MRGSEHKFGRSLEHFHRSQTPTLPPVPPRQVCAKSGEMAAAVEIRRLETTAQEKHAHRDFLGEWRERRNATADRPRPWRQWRDDDRK